MKGNTDDPALVRIPHDLVDGESYPENEIEIVCESLSDFFKFSNIE